MAEPLSPSDASALQAERGPVHMHVGGLCVFDGRVEREAVVRRLRERIHLIPRYTMRLESSPLGLANPAWVEDEGFDPDRHVRRMALPAPGRDAELCELAGQILSEPLDRARPLWQLTVIEGLARGRTAIVAKMHHALVDGLAAVDVSTVILDPTPEGLDIPPPEPRDPPEQPPGLRSRLSSRGWPLRSSTCRAGWRARRWRVRPIRAPTRARCAARPGWWASWRSSRPQAPETRLNAQIGRERRLALARCRLDDVKAVRRATGATVNDVLLTAVALMLSDYLGEDAPDSAVALVPVSIRAEDERGEGGNRISTVFVDLPLRGEPLDRVRQVNEAMNAVKGSAQVRAGALIVGATGIVPPIVSSLAVRAMSAPRMFNLVVSNVPGPQQTFYLAGVPMLEVFPAVPLNPRNQALSIGIVSYDGGVRLRAAGG